MNKSKVDILIEIVFIELLFGVVWYYAHGSLLFINHLILGCDIGISNLNSNVLTSFFEIPPRYFNIFLIFMYHYFTLYLPDSMDYFLFFISFLIPLGFYYLMITMNFNRYTRITATLFYSINPLTILFGLGWEYTSIFLFFPLILAFLIKYHKYNNRQDLIILSMLIALLFIFADITYLKFIIFIIISIIILDLSLSKKATIKRKILDYSLWLLLIIVLILPLLIHLIYSLNIFTHAASTNPSTVSWLIGITKFEFANSNFEVNLYGLPYVANQLTSIHYESTWYGALYLFLILFSLASIFKYKGNYKDIYYALFFVLIFLILFQYGVYNGSLIFLYNFSIFNVYNYPLFFYISQILIYAMFFAISYSIIIDLISQINPKKIFNGIKRFLPIFITVIFISSIVVSSLPVIQYENINSLSPYHPVPDYIIDLTEKLKPFSNSRVMILPDNESSINYLYMGVSYYNVYGYPYGYQNFISLYPNLTVYSMIGKAFQNEDIQELLYLLESQDINAIVVLNTLSQEPIKYQGTQINGGGALFCDILNKTLIYTPIIWNKNYALYKYNALEASNIIKNVSIDNKYIQYFPAVVKNNITVVTSDLSYEEYPINIITSKESNLTYNQYININRTYFKAINQNFTNIMFYYYNDTPIPAWIENIKNGTAWIYLKIDREVNQTIYLRIYPKDVNKMSSNGYLGEAPQLSGSGTTKLPSYIEYSSVVVGVYGYGYNGNAYTLNFTFNPSLFSNVENSNLSNLAFYTYDGKLLNAFLHGSPSNKSTSATVSISFPGGVSYFMMNPTNMYGRFGNSYNIFYMGFAPKNYNLNALHANVTYTPQPALELGYLPYAVKNFGIYGKYDNGKNVFPYYNNYINGYSFASAWSLMIPVNGYGLLAGFPVYVPGAYINYFLTNLYENQEGVSYSYLIGGQTASPIYITNTNNTSLMGPADPKNIHWIVNQTLQQHSIDIGFGTNITQISVYYNYNNSESYTYNTIYNHPSINGFTTYGIYYNGTVLQFKINNTNVANFNYVNKDKINLMTSAVWGGTMVTLYTYVKNVPVDEKMPIISIGTPKVLQAYFNGKIILNPAFANSTVLFTAFSLNNTYNSMNWKIGNNYFNGQSVSYKFTSPGYYNVTFFDGNYEYEMVEEILPEPQTSKLNYLNYTGTGTHLIESGIKSNNTLYIWYVNGQKIQNNSYNLMYNFNYPGIYSIKVFIVNNSGNYSKTFIINIINKNVITIESIILIIYNIILPILLIIYIINGKFRNTINNFFKKSYKIFKIKY
ncbi:MAG: hypothetical protein RXO36_04605 [Candidatus Nanopusillus acidilobi]